MYSYKHKIFAVLVATIATYFGFQALDLCLGLFQTHIYFTVSWYVFAFHIFWLTFIFDLHLKKSGHLAHARGNFVGVRVFWEAFKSRTRHLYHWTYLRHYLNYLILPSIMYWSVIALMYVNPFHELFKDGLIIITTAGLAVVYWHLKEAFSHHMEMHDTGLKVLALAKLLAVYLCFTALFAIGWYFGISLAVILPTVFLLTFLLVYQALFQHKLIRADVYVAILMLCTLIVVVFAVVFDKWNVNFYSAGLIVAAVYSVSWGILHKFLDRTLTRAILWEYIFMLVVLVSLVLATHDFQGRI